MPPMAEQGHTTHQHAGGHGHGFEARHTVHVAAHRAGMPPSLEAIEAHSMLAIEAVDNMESESNPARRRGGATGPPPKQLRLRKDKSAARSTIRLPDGSMRHVQQHPPTLKEVEGEYSVLTHMPEPRALKRDASPIPILRWGALAYWMSRQTVGKFGRRIKRFAYKAVVHICWLLSLLWWQILAAIAVTLTTIGPNHLLFRTGDSETAQARMEELVDIHRIYGGVIGFVVAFRMNIAYQAFMEGRRLVGQLQNGIQEVVLECYAALPQPDDHEEKEEEEEEEEAAMRDAMALRISPPASSSASATVAAPGVGDSDGDGGGRRVGFEEGEEEEEAALQLEAAKEVRRLANVLFAFVRQDVRESRYGFLVGSDMERVKFDERENYFADPVRPRLWDLLSEEETIRYAKIPSRMRPCAVASEIMRHAAFIERHCRKAGRAAPSVGSAIKTILTVHESMARVNSSPLPYPFLCILHISTFLFIYSTPFLYLDHSGCPVTLAALFCLIFSYYGLLEIGLQIERPYAYCHGSFNLELEAFGLQSHNDTLEVAKLWSTDLESFVPEYLTFPSRDDGRGGSKELKTGTRGEEEEEGKDTRG